MIDIEENGFVRRHKPQELWLGIFGLILLIFALFMILLVSPAMGSVMVGFTIILLIVFAFLLSKSNAKSKILDFPWGISNTTFWSIIIGFNVFIFGIGAIQVVIYHEDLWIALIACLCPSLGFTLISLIWRYVDLPQNPHRREKEDTDVKMLRK